MPKPRHAALPIQFDERLRFTIPEASRLLKQSRAQTYVNIKEKTLRAIKDGRRRYIPGTEIARRSRVGR